MVSQHLIYSAGVIWTIDMMIYEAVHGLLSVLLLLKKRKKKKCQLK